MDNISKLLEQVSEGEPTAAGELLPLIYDQLKRVAALKLADEQNCSSLQATALVHDAYVRLVDEGDRDWKNRRYFYAAAAEAMRRILVEHARRKQSLRRGGDWERVGLSYCDPAEEEKTVDVLALNEALSELEAQWPERAQLVKLRYFSGMTIAEAAQAIGISTTTADRYWQFSRAFLYAKLQ